MTIRPGETWGEAVAVPDDLIEIGTDAALAAHLRSGDRRPVLLVGGDLLRTLGGRSTGNELRRFPIDLLRVEADGRPLTAIAHVVARDRRWSWWYGSILAVMNVDRLGRWDVAPRAHPNDGRADVVEVDAAMGLRARWQARRRLPTGTHVPHPAIRMSRITDRSWDVEPPLALWVDAVREGTVRSLRVAVEPDGATVHT